MIKLYFPCNFIGLTQGYKTSHKAIDMGWNSSKGGPNHKILAPADGKIKAIRSNYNKTDKTGSSYGNYIQIDHGNGVETLVAHLKYNSAKVKKGDTVKKGDVIALMGNTGHSTGTHCHYEVRINGSRLNPLKYTYATQENYVSDNTKKNYDILWDKEQKEEEVTPEPSIPEEATVFEYLCTKTGTYKIKLFENEKLIIKN